MIIAGVLVTCEYMSMDGDKLFFLNKDNCFKQIENGSFNTLKINNVLYETTPETIAILNIVKTSI